MKRRKGKVKEKQINHFKQKEAPFMYEEFSPLDKMSKGRKKERMIQLDQEKDWDEKVEEKKGNTKEEKKQQKVEKQRKRNWKNGSFLENVKEEKEQEWKRKEKNSFFLQQKWIKQEAQKNESFSIENLLRKEKSIPDKEEIGEKERFFDKDTNRKDLFTEKEQVFVRNPFDKGKQGFDYQNGRKEKMENSICSLSTKEENPLWIEQDVFIEKEESIVERKESFFQEEMFDTVEQEVPCRKQKLGKKRISFAKKEEFLEDLKKENVFVKKENSLYKKDAAFSKEEIVTMEQDFILAEEFISKPESLISLESEVVSIEEPENLRKENNRFISNTMVLEEESFAASKEEFTPTKEESSFIFLQENSIGTDKEKNFPEEKSIFQREKDLFVKEKDEKKSDEQTKKFKRSFHQTTKKEPIQKGILREEKEEASVLKSKKWERQKKKAERAEVCLYRAKEKLPKQKEYHWERVFDEKSGTGKYVLKVVEKEKDLRNPFLLEKTAKYLQGESRDWVHRKVREVEKENTGLEAVHKSEQLLERTFGFVVEAPLSKQQKRQKRIEKLEKKKRTAESLFLYQDYLEKHPELQKKVVQKQIQKKRIQREYAKNYRKGQAAKRKKEGWKKTDLFPEMIKKKIEKGKNRTAFLWMGGGILFFLLIFLTGVSFCGALFGEMVSAILTGSYLSEPKEIDQLELNFTWMEMELQDRMDRIEEDYPDYQEYEYSLEEIGHNPFALISYFSAKDSEFIANEKEQELEELFQESYSLTLTPKIEIRTKMETETRFDPVTGVEWEEEVEVEYEVSILKVELEVISLEELAYERLDLEQKELFETYFETKGGLQQFASPLATDWYHQISSFYGYRKHPITGQKQIHRGLDLAVPEGSPIYATHTGVVTTAAYHSSYGNYIVITDENGFLTKYAHLSRFYVSGGEEVEQGSLIGEVGSTGNSTGSHLHLEVMRDGMYYNPIFYFATGKFIP